MGIFIHVTQITHVVTCMGENDGARQIATRRTAFVDLVRRQTERTRSKHIIWPVSDGSPGCFIRNLSTPCVCMRILRGDSPHQRVVRLELILYHVQQTCFSRGSGRPLSEVPFQDVLLHGRGVLNILVAATSIVI